MQATNHAVKIYATPPHSCSYLDGEQAINAFVDPDFKPTPLAYQMLIDKGYRRSGEHLYRPACRSCAACLSCRVPVSQFKPDRSQRRCWKRNSDLEVEIVPASFSEEAFSLYRSYLNSRHADGDMANPSEASFTSFLMSEWSETVFIQFRSQRKLIAVAVADVLPRGYSAVYTFFDPEAHRRSLGTYAILWEIEHARMQGMPYLYLGYWIRGSQKMRYKARFAPLEVLQDGIWQQPEQSSSTGVDR